MNKMARISFIFDPYILSVHTHTTIANLFPSLQLIAVRGTLESRKDWAASYAPTMCFKSPFACLEDLTSQNDLNSSSKAGVLSSSIDAMLGRLNDLFLGVEQDGSSTCQLLRVENTVRDQSKQMNTQMKHYEEYAEIALC